MLESQFAGFSSGLAFSFANVWARGISFPARRGVQQTLN